MEKSKNKALVLTETVKVPSLQELYDDRDIAIKQNQLNIVLNASPKPEWVKVHPFVKNLKDLPIERVEYLLTMIFSKWWVEVKEIKVLANSIVVCVRLFVKNPITGDIDYQDGVGAVPIQVQKGHPATAFEFMNSSAVQIGAPAAKSYAIKDAAEQFGRIFGKDLNRKDAIEYVDRLQASIDSMKKLGIIEQIQNATAEESKVIWLNLTQKERDDSDIKTAYDSKC